MRARLSEARDESAELEADNDRLRGELKTKSRQLTQAKQYRKHVAADKREAQGQVSSLQAELDERTEEAEELASRYEEMHIELLFEQSRDDAEQENNRTTSAHAQPLTLFHDGRYDDALRAVIYAHISAGVGKDRIAPLVAITMQLLAHKHITQLPSPATIARMSAELNSLTQIQLYERLTSDPTAITVLAHDGTTKSGKKLGAGVVHIDRSVTASKSEDTRESVALFVREQADGTAESGVRVLTDAIADINAVGSTVFPNRRAATSEFHGFLSDHNTTERKTNELLSRDAKELEDALEMFCWNHKYVQRAYLCVRSPVIWSVSMCFDGHDKTDWRMSSKGL
jgi:hypothetical protein